MFCSYFEIKHSEVTQASIELPIHATSSRRIPTLITNKAQIQATVDGLEYQDTTANNYDIEDCNIVEDYTIIADMGTYYKTFVINNTSRTSNSTLADTGANCSMTANINILKNVRKLDTPIIVGTAVTNSGHVQNAEIQCDDGDIIYTTCFYNENASDTIISPQSIVDESPSFIC